MHLNFSAVYTQIQVRKLNLYDLIQGLIPSPTRLRHGAGRGTQSAPVVVIYMPSYVLVGEARLMLSEGTMNSTDLQPAIGRTIG
jgi:hypothetical protein